MSRYDPNGNYKDMDTGCTIQFFKPARKVHRSSGETTEVYWYWDTMRKVAQVQSFYITLNIQCCIIHRQHP